MLNRNMQTSTTSLAPANTDYFSAVSSNAFRLPGGNYIVMGRIGLKQAIIADHNAPVLIGLPFVWKYTSDITGASVDTGESLIMQGAQGESSVRLGVKHKAWPAGVVISFSAIIPAQLTT